MSEPFFTATDCVYYLGQSSFEKYTLTLKDANAKGALGEK